MVFRSTCLSLQHAHRRTLNIYIEYLNNQHPGTMTIFTTIMVFQKVLLTFYMDKSHRGAAHGDSLLSDPPGNVMRAPLLDSKDQDEEREIRIERENVTLGVGVRKSQNRSKSQAEEEILMEENEDQIIIKREDGVKLVIDN